MWITEIHGQAGGLLQCYLHADYPQHDASVGIAAAVGIDYLLGGAHCGQGLGALVVSAFAAHAFDQHPSAATCIATPAQATRRRGVRSSGPDSLAMASASHRTNRSPSSTPRLAGA